MEEQWAPGDSSAQKTKEAMKDDEEGTMSEAMTEERLLYLRFSDRSDEVHDELVTEVLRLRALLEAKEKAPADGGPLEPDPDRVSPIHSTGSPQSDEGSVADAETEVHKHGRGALIRGDRKPFVDGYLRDARRAEEAEKLALDAAVDASASWEALTPEERAKVRAEHPNDARAVWRKEPGS